MQQTIDRYKQDMMSMHDKNRDKMRLQQFTESMENEEQPPLKNATLKINVCEENASPISNASVLICTLKNNCLELVTCLKTDSFGNTPPMCLPLDFTYIIKASAEGYHKYIEENVTLEETCTTEKTITLTRDDLIYNKAPLVFKAVNDTILKTQHSSLCTFPIKLGDCGECVKNLQQKICALSRVFSSLTPPKITGTYGNNTATAVGKLQSLFNLEVTYCVDKLTWECIHTASSTITDEEYCDQAAQMCLNFNKDKILKKGDCDDDVSLLQFLLVKLNHVYCNLPPVNITGQYDDATEKSVLTLQKILSLPSTGRVGNCTMQRIINLLTDAN
jgi:hypothetical protein